MKFGAKITDVCISCVALTERLITLRSPFKCEGVL